MGLFRAWQLCCSGGLIGQDNRSEMTGVFGIIGVAVPNPLGKLFVVPLIHLQIKTIHTFRAECQPVAIAG